MRDLVAFFLEASEGVLEYMDIVDEPVQVTRCRATLSTPGVRHAPGSHHNNFLTGVYCVDAPRGVELCYGDPRPQAHIMVPRTDAATPALARTQTVPLAEGTLALFPAWLEHWLAPTDFEHLTIEFNTMFPTYLASMTHPMWRGNLWGRN